MMGKQMKATCRRSIGRDEILGASISLMTATDQPVSTSPMSPSVESALDAEYQDFEGTMFSNRNLSGSPVSPLDLESSFDHSFAKGFKSKEEEDEFWSSLPETSTPFNDIMNGVDQVGHGHEDSH